MTAADGTVSSDVTLPAEILTAFVSNTFAAAGAGSGEAAAIAENLVGANLAGHDSHGVVRVPRYLEAVKQGSMHFGRSVETVIDGGAFALIDGQFGFGQVIGQQAVDIGLEKARKHSVSVIALRNAGHLGRIGAWAEYACAAGLVSIHFVNVARSLLVAPFGSGERRMSTAPVAIGVVNAGGDDFILDFATSKVAEGKVLMALKGGKPTVPGSLVDANGQPTHDPLALYGPVPEDSVPDPRAGSGALVAMGDHKGSGLALACELLAGALTGSGTSGPGSGPYNGMLSIYLSPDAMDDRQGIGHAVADYIEFVRSARPADPQAPVMIPGDPERKARAKRLSEGVPLPRPTWDSLILAARESGVRDLNIPEAL
ncbi:malate/lactate/ureidoglycolate dehydrogenase [Pelagibius sp. Alg239-R121]|uniref:malate/lactate/ureidoglycolate dehydrogenase n=1 Tax=Pelagibius sp. Alg239-R121 TaxID=2993448 RepID=UPI0024A6A26E|nr:malate/lactate/ureidoglycolate dehydrogenase [Pelagibius sp. Alg239-R121]